MNGVVLIGHGSLHSDSGASMIRLAARLRERGVAPIAEAGFLNFSRPTIAEAVAKCVRAGATSITVQPYFLIDGVYVQQDLPGDISKVAAQFPALTIRVAACFGFHEKLAAIALERVARGRPADERHRSGPAVDGARHAARGGKRTGAAAQRLAARGNRLHLGRAGLPGLQQAAHRRGHRHARGQGRAQDRRPCPTFCIAAAT